MNISNVSLGSGNVVAVVETAGFISQITVEGISFSLRSGKNCADALNSNFDNQIESYQKLSVPLINERNQKIIRAKTV